MLLYLHGFRSSPQSAKARMIAARLAQLGLGHHWACPQLPVSPREVIAGLRAQCWPKAQDTVVGSSLGGFYARYLAQTTGCRAVLLNPSVQPDRSLADRVGLSQGWHDGEPHDFRAEYLDEFAELAVPDITQPERYFLIAAKGDEILDWRDMVAAFPGTRSHILEGGDHAISNFMPLVDEVLAFAGLYPP